MKFTLALIASLFVVQAQAFQVPLVTTFGSTISTSCVFGGKCSMKILQAQEDAAAFVASEGAIRTVALNQALEAIRSENPTAQISDMDLATEILNY